MWKSCHDTIARMFRGPFSDDGCSVAVYTIYTDLSLYPFNCTRNSPHRHLTKCRGYQLENLWKQVSLPRRCPDVLFFLSFAALCWKIICMGQRYNLCLFIGFVVHRCYNVSHQHDLGSCSDIIIFHQELKAGEHSYAV